ncbi:hypothetical protein DSL72_001061 [Monilinia vaccinii-corymbosi]|uniref:Bola-like protein n=1 Tax=Monilinia vaccinii-corymbosi TaxID=61207 RepID=A0A8A3P5E1_9HELO|nr:hypothetical protein DSL72_001061 [Monilinia vaccinii-corymbosi]
MNKSALTGLRHCLQTRAPPLRSHNASLRRASRPNHSNTCVARNIRSYSIPTINSPRGLPRCRASHPSSAPLSRLRFYSSESASTVKGTNDAADPLQPPDHLDGAEKKIWDLLYTELSPTKLQVQDISGGCGSMYGIEIVSEKFRGLNMLKQQRLVNKVLGEEIKRWHGVQLRTSVP